MRDASEVTTRKLYYEDACRREFQAEVFTARECRRDGRLLVDVVLDQTCFFPEEGGQMSDTGSLAGFPVTDVQIEGGEIHHYVEVQSGVLQTGSGEEGLPPTDMSAVPAALAPGSVVSGSLNWTERFSNMQQHSGEHLFSGIVHRRFGYENVGFHLSAAEVTLDFDGVLPQEAIPELEAEVNAAIWQDIPSEIRITTAKEREGLTYRSKLDLEGEVRIVTFPGVDACACCAPHVSRTGEIGLLKVTGMINWKGGVRVSILCGDRALRLMQGEHAQLTEAARFLSTSPDQIYPLLVKMKEELRRTEAALKSAQSEALRARAKAIPGEAVHAVLFAEDADVAAAREAVNAMMAEHSGYCGIFIGSDDTSYSFVIGSAGRDCRELAALLRENLGSRGGGRPEMIQGSVAAAGEELKKLILSL